MGNTLAALLANRSLRLQTVVAIEGYRNLLTDGSAAAAVAAWAGTDWDEALSGLEVEWNISQALNPWQPFDAVDSSVLLHIMDASGTGADTFAIDVFNRENLTTTTLAEDFQPSSGTIVVRSAAGFAATGEVHVGCEAVAYGTNDGATELTDLTRGLWSPFAQDDGHGFQRTHIAAENIEGVDADATTSTTVSSAPLDWTGRWVGVWLHRVDGTTLDTKAEAHLAFAGRIASIRERPDGRVTVTLMSVQDAIGEAIILRHQWRARMKAGIRLNATVDTRFHAHNRRIYLSGGTSHLDLGDANALVVVPSGAVAPNEINEGQYTGDELATLINAWLAAEVAAGRLLFRGNFTYNAQENGEPRSSLTYTDPTISTGGPRAFTLTADNDRVRTFLGWDSDGITAQGDTAAPTTGYSANPPQRIAAEPSGFLQLEAVTGEFVDQAALMRPGFVQSIPSGAKGFVRIGDAIIPCAAPTGTADDTELEVNLPINLTIGAGPTDWPNLAVDDSGYVEVQQVLILEATFKTLLLTLLASTGGGLNWVAYDTLPEHVSCAIPYDLLTTDLEAELAAAPAANRTMTVIVDKPTAFRDLFNVSCVLRGGLQLIWRRGRLALKAFATPTSAATLTIGSDDRAAPLDAQDDMRAITDELDEHMRNVVVIRSNGNPFTGTYRDTNTLVDPGSAGSFGSRAVTLTARNAASGAEIVGEDVHALLPSLAAMLTFLGRPQWRLRVPITFNLFEAATPGEVCIFSDLYARDPATGRRGITNRPALVVATRYHGWGGRDPAVGECDVMLFPRLSLAPYCPCAQVDETQANAGYNSITKTLTCYAHEYSEAADAADASYFVVGSKVRVMQIDPDDPASPLSFDDVVAAQSGNTIQLTTGIGGWDATKRYRVYSDDYGDATSTQRQNAYQADDADGQIADLRQPYALGAFGVGQVATFTESAATDLPERPPTAAAGDGVALDTGHARAIALGLNNGISYKWAVQQPEVVEEMSYGGSGTYTLVYAAPVFLGFGTGQMGWTRKLYVGPTLYKVGGPSGNVRVTIARRMPRSADPTVFSRTDVVRVPPYSSTTFNTTSTTPVVATPVALDLDHLELDVGPLGGWGWLLVELGTAARFRGFGELYVGPMVTS